MLNETSIETSLRNLVARLTEGNTEKAQFYLDDLDFQRPQDPIQDPTGRVLFVDPDSPFATERVNATRGYVEACRLALSRGDVKGALEAAERALNSWREGKPNEAAGAKGA